MVQEAVEWLTAEEFWLPGGVRWGEVRRGPDCYLHAVPWLVAVLLVIRSLIESWIAAPVGEILRVSDRPHTQPPPHNAVLWSAYKHNKNPEEQQVSLLSAQLGWAPYRVHKWFWKARNCRRPSTLTKFKESFWRFVFYAAVLLYGCAVLVKEPFFWDLRECYRGYPHRTVGSGVLLYWAVQLAFYCSLLLSVLRDTRRKDLVQTVVHHMVTITLLATCYFIGMLPMGTLILLTHDISDVFLEFAKLMKYARMEGPATLVFALFASVFFITRLIILPFWLIWSVVFHLPQYVTPFPALRLILLLLLTLQVLHLYWFSLIVGMVVRLGRGEGVGKDARSDSEPSSCSDFETPVRSKVIILHQRKQNK